jgi:spermidine synthase
VRKGRVLPGRTGLEPTLHFRSMRLLLIAAFICSGAAGLVYESVWTRYLGLFVGHTAYAQIIVLAVFLGGMAIGAGVVARYSARIKLPLVWYASVELGVALGGFLFHYAFRFATNAAYDTIFPALGGTTLLVAKWSIAALLILPQSVLLGATFPLMSAGYLRLERGDGDATTSTGRTLALLYFVNSIGAAFGVLIAGFYLVRVVGLPGTLASAALTNMLAAGIVFVAAGWLTGEERAPLSASSSNVAPPNRAPYALSPTPRTLRPTLYMIAFGTAIASFIYEIAWVRMLSLVLGAATHSFELMLSAFILGLSLGAFAIRKRADSLRDPLRTLAIVQWVMGVLALATIPLYLASYRWTAALLDVLNRTDSGYTIFNYARYAFCLVVMLPATFCAGMTLPLITRTAMAAGGGEADIGRVYSINTLGSIVGVAFAALVLIPALNLKGTLVLGAAIDMSLGIYIVARFFFAVPSGRRLLLITAGGGAIVVANAVFTQHFDRGLLTSGVYRYATAPEPGTRILAFYRDGRTATVSVRGDGDNGYSLATNGKPDASLTKEWLQPMAPSDPRGPIGGDQVTQAFLPIITLAHAPKAKNAAVIGFGSGVSSHILLGSPELENLFTIEIEPSMAQASRIFHAANNRVYDDRRSTIVFDDAKSYFAAAGRKFDLIMSEPSNPWVSGVSGLFTDEFYARVKRYLSDDGVFGQWLHLYEIDDPLVMSVMAAIHKNFPAYEVFFTSSVDVLIVATPAKQLRVPDWSVVAYPKIAEDLTRFRQLSPALFEGLRVTNREALAPLIEMGIPVNSDFHPYLDLGAEKTRFMKTQASGFIGMGSDRFPIGLALSGRRTPFGIATETAVEINRAEALALGAALRARIKPRHDAGDDDILPRARHRADALRTQLAAGPPDDWNLWLTDALTVDEELHGGTIGVVDEGLYSDLFSYTAKYGAPERVTSALRFMHAMSVQDWTATDTLGNRSIELGETLPGLAVSGDLLRDAMVVADLKQHDIPGARKALVILSNHGTRATNDLRTRLLEAWVARAEKADSAKKATSAPRK